MTSAQEMKIFVPIIKVDAKKRVVYGIITQEVVDKSGEMFDYASGKPEIEKWSKAISDATGGKSKGNLRAMHSSIAAGKFTEFEFDDDNKAVYASAKVVDEDEWKKVEEGVYSGFSIGGGYKKRWVDEENPGVMRFTPTIAEVSLVDNPCVPTATFEYIKADGGHEFRKFNTNKPNEDIMTVQESTKPADDKPVADVEKTASATGTEGAVNKGELTDEEKEALAKADAERRAAAEEGEQVWKSKITGQTFAKKSEMIAHNIEHQAKESFAPADALLKQIDAALTKAETKTDDEDEEQEGDDEETKKTKKAKKAKKEADAAEASAKAKKEEKDKEDADKAAKAVAASTEAKPEMKKGLYDIGTFANILQNICWLQSGAESEAKWEGDNSPLPEALKVWLKQGAEILKAYVEEEVSELFPAALPEVEVMAMAAKMTGEQCDALAKVVKVEAVKTALEKAGSRHSKGDKESLKALHKSATDHADGIMKCLKEIGVMEEEKEDAEKAAGSGSDQTLLKRELESERIKRESLEKHVGTFSQSLEKVLQRIEAIERQPMPPKGAVRAVSKSQDAGAAGDGAGPTLEQVQDFVSKMSPEQRTLMSLKVSLAEGVKLAN